MPYQDSTAVCPTCGRNHCKVKESRTIATRWEASKSLGFSGYCPDCQCSFKAEGEQLALSQ
jgi:hypothetical protein